MTTTTTIHSNQAVDGRAAPEAPSDASLRGQAAALLRFGAADGAMARAGVALDQQQRRAQRRERHAQAHRHEQAMERVAQLRDAAKKQRAGGIVAAVGSVVQGALSLAPGGEGSQGAKTELQSMAMAVQAGTRVAEGALGSQADKARTDAEGHEVLAQFRADEAAAHGTAAADAQALRDRARAHQDAVARARMEARAAVLRG